MSLRNIAELLRVHERRLRRSGGGDESIALEYGIEDGPDSDLCGGGARRNDSGIRHILFVFNNPEATAAARFGLWLQAPLYFQWGPWRLFAGLIAGLSLYAAQLLGNSN